MSSDPLQEGIAALQRGDRASARQFLSEATTLEPDNETAWYYLAAAEDDMALRRTYLERVLIINPNNTRAQDVLKRMDDSGVAATSSPSATAAAASGTSGTGSAASSSGTEKRKGPAVRPIGSVPGAPGAAETGGFAMPFEVPGAPARVGPIELFRDGLVLFQRGLDALRRVPGAYENEVGQATWWRFWLLVGWCAAVVALINAAAGLIAQVFGVFLGRFSFGAILFIVLALVIAVPLTLIVQYAGVAASGWYAREQQKSTVPLYRHAYAIAIYIAPASVITAIIGGVGTILGIGFLTGIVEFAISIYALYMAALALKTLHAFTSDYQEYITIAVYILVVIVVSIVVGVFVGLFTAGGALAGLAFGLM